MYYLCMNKSSDCSAPACIMRRIQLTRDKTQITSIHDLQCLCQELIAGTMVMPYCIRKRSECHLMNITLIWEDLSRDTTQFVSIHCLCNSLHGVNNQHGHVYLHERKAAKISFTHFTVALRQGDAVNHYLLHRWHKRYSWFIISSCWLPDIP